MNTVLYFADLQSSFARDWISNAALAESLEVAAVCSRSGHIWSPDANPTAEMLVSATERAGRARSTLSGMLPAAGMERLLYRRTRRNESALSAACRQRRPDIVHSLRLTYEAIVATEALPDRCHVGSVWGNDYTLHGRHQSVRRQLEQASRALVGLTADCDRDLHLATDFGFADTKPKVFLPGSLGTPDRFFHTPPLEAVTAFAQGRTVVCYPRGIRGYARPELFVEGVAEVVAAGLPVAAVMVGVPDGHLVRSLVESLPVADSFQLFDTLDREEFAGVLSASDIVVSPTSHDGTPNSILEAMASGCYPVVSNLPSLHEWIDDEATGQFFELNVKSIAAALTRALGADRNRAIATNKALVASKAGERINRERLVAFYESLLEGAGNVGGPR